ncbi:hypothetical protein AMAG_18211 [Allomyces macrogynus ATCC 38327]|uniref:mRNA stability protein n=1 Tax=Allomyces macrogynus (strain ATCC 38327) TaxID=578462 RepID=A0A0L0SB16_ALLM3|nr:hypothetical protein AMAG_18211 [Allomyces macrogynus ATCC 38327]|eukprot:KNE59594.1 hypothetical protein AMAG_18211 [Allomyces macrogynus ATCC 38327]
MTQVFCTFADRFNCVRPKFTDDHTMVLKQVIHPVIYESALEAGRHVVPNDCELDHDKCLIVISGANMGGKTCYMRTVGAAVILAQIGCPVPATSAQLPIYDAIYTRFGSYDDLAHNQSTFAAEMVDLRPPDPAVIADQERKLLDKYGKLPMAKKSVLGHRLKERKYFDSGDYAMSKAGKSSPSTVGSAHPTPDMIPHSHPATSGPDIGRATGRDAAGARRPPRSRRLSRRPRRRPRRW